MESRSRNGKTRLALIVQYDGTRFNGWQIQDNGRTVQAEIEKAIRILTKENVRIVASGRTDTGVHSIGQVIHFDTLTNISFERMCIGLNGILPKDISIVNIHKTNKNFHARFSAVEREYKYLIYNHPFRTPFTDYRAMWFKNKIEIDYIKSITNYLIGEFDFASFCKKKSIDGSTIRRIKSIDIKRQGDFIEIYIKGNAFLHNMVRIIVGTILDMVKNNSMPEEIIEILDKKNRSYSGETAPPYGLYLNKVIYDPPLSSYESLISI